MSRPKGRRLLRELVRAERVYDDNRFEEVERIAQSVLAASEGPRDSTQALARGRAHELLGALAQDREDHETALKHFLAAEETLDGLPEHREWLGRIQLSIVQQLYRHGLEDALEEYVQRCAGNVAGTPYAAHIEPWVDAHAAYADETVDWRERLARLERELAETEAKAPPRVRKKLRRRARERAEWAEDAWVMRQFTLQRQIATIQILHGTDEECALALLMITAQVVALYDGGLDARNLVDSALAFAIFMDRPNLAWEEGFDEMIRMLGRIAQATGALKARAQVSFVQAIRAWRLGHLETAMIEAVNALALSTVDLLRTESVVLRQEAASAVHEHRELALRLAVASGQAGVAAELIESSRLQSLPVSGTRIEQALEAEDPRSILQATSTSLGVLSHVCVDGQSVLATAHAGLGLPSGPVVELSAVINAVGGTTTGWWGCFIAVSKAHWVVRSPTGTLTCGTHEFNDDDKQALTRFQNALDAVSDPYEPMIWLDRAEEAELMAALADVVVPDLLRAELLREERPISLVVASNMLAVLPLPALVLRRSDQTRLIERATVRIQPPAFLVRLEAQPEASRQIHPLLVACTDPRGDLPHARTEVPARVRLTHQGAASHGSLRATRENLCEVLSGLIAGAPGIFFYSGHAGTYDVQGSLNAFLALDDEGSLSAWDLFHLDASEPALHSPSRAVLSACDSGGSSGAGGGEWLGLGAGLLHAGARQVISTAWSIYDTPFTAQFDNSLVDGLRTAADPAELLAGLQREALDTWRFSPNPLASPPAIWAAYQCLGQLDGHSRRVAPITPSDGPGQRHTK